MLMSQISRKEKWFRILNITFIYFHLKNFMCYFDIHAQGGNKVTTILAQVVFFVIVGTFKIHSLNDLQSSP